MKRVSVYLDQANSEEITSTAKNEDKSLFTFANEWLLTAAKLSSAGWSPAKLQALCDSFSLMKTIDAITLPSDFVDELIARQYKSDKEGLLKMFRDMGSEIASVVKIEAPTIGEFAQLAKEFLALLPLKMFDLTTDEKRNEIDIKVVGAGRRLESTECALELLVSFLNAYGFVVKYHDVNLGTLRVLAHRSDSAPT